MALVSVAKIGQLTHKKTHQAMISSFINNGLMNVHV